jgi:hypothetical protein
MTETPETLSAKDLLAKCDRILDFMDGNARSDMMCFAEEVKGTVAALRARLEAIGKAQRAVHGDACLRCGGTDWYCADEVDALLAPDDSGGVSHE